MRSSPATEPRRRWARPWRHPALHFALAGALLFAADRGWRAAPRLADDRNAGGGERSRAVDPRRAEEVLELEALRLGLDRDDRLVRDRLVKLGRFLDLADPSDEGALEREARALGLEREDAVIRRYLAQQMRVALAGAPSPPAEDEVRRRYAQWKAEAPAEERFRLAHVYLGRDRHGAAIAEDADRLLHRMRAEEVRPEQAASWGDAFAGGRQIGPATAAEIGRMLGPEFAAALVEAPVGGWFGPLPSSYGLHIVWLAERSPRPRPGLDAVRNRIVGDLVRERRSERLRRGLLELSERSDTGSGPTPETRAFHRSRREP